MHDMLDRNVYQQFLYIWQGNVWKSSGMAPRERVHFATCTRQCDDVTRVQMLSNMKLEANRQKGVCSNR
eukprot:760499-Hanusia_phi.AAC.5